MEKKLYESSNKKIPKNIEECIKQDLVSKNLWEWCKKLEKWGKILFWVLIIGGLFLSINSSIIEEEIIVSSWVGETTEIRETFSFEIFIPLFLNSILYAFIEYWIYHIITILIGALASIVQNTTINSNIALYNAAKDLDSKIKNDVN